MSSIDKQRQAVSAARSIIDSGKVPRRSEAAHIRQLLLDAEATLAKAATEEAKAEIRR
jgi:hypothetical protein